MKRVTAAIRVRALRGAVLILGRAMTACSRGLLKASASLPNTDVLAEERITVQDPYAAIERLLVLQLLERQIPCSRSDLEAALNTIEPLVVNDALRALFEKDVVYIYREQVWATQCLLRLDELDLITI
jgi:hypothetical protein